MRALRLRPDQHTYTPLLKSAATLAEIEQMLAEMQADRVRLNKYHFTTVRAKLARKLEPAAQALLAQLSAQLRAQ